MIASSRPLLAVSFLVCTLLFYTLWSRHGVAPPTTSEAITSDSPSRTPQNGPSSNISSSFADIVNDTANCPSHVSEVERPRILQATMFFGDYLGNNQRTLQSHINHANRWGYGNYILRREIVGAGQWDKFIFSKLLLLLELIMGQLKRPREERAEWVIWYDADTLILNSNIQWELFLPDDVDPEIHFMATKNIDGFNAGLFFMRVHEWSVEILSDAYSLRRLRPEIDISGCPEQNSMRYILSQETNKKHVLYQPQSWYNGAKGAARAETEVNEGDMLVHFMGTHHDTGGEGEKEVMGPWYTEIEQHPDKWQLALEETRYPGEIKAFWKTYKEAKEMLNTVYVRPNTSSGPDQDVKHAMDALKWAIEEEAYDAEKMKKCMEDMAHVLRAAENPQVAAGSSSHVDLQASEGDKERTESALGQNKSSEATSKYMEYRRSPLVE